MASLSLKDEWKRKTIHLFTSIVPIAYFYWPQRDLFLALTGGLFIFAILTEIARINVTKIKQIYEKFFTTLLRAEETGNTPNGATMLLLAFWLSIFLFPAKIAVTVLLFLTVSDTMAALAGKLFGRHKIWGKTWEGFLTFFFTAVFISWILMGLSISGLSAALLAAVTELLPLKINDNLLIPLISGTFLLFMG